MTIEDIAKKSGSSMMTVSRALNNRDGVSEETRQKILAIAKELGYRPNQTARSLATNRTFTIGMVVSDISNPFFSIIVRAAEDVAYKNQYTVLLLNTGESTEREKKVLDSLLEKGVDGVIYCVSRLPQDDLEFYVNQFSHMVLINRVISNTSTNHVGTINVDDYTGAKEAIAYLARLGKKKIAMVAWSQVAYSAQLRVKGYKDGLSECGYSFDDSLIKYCSFSPNSMEDGYKSTLNLLEQHPDIDAFWAHSDLVALGILQACSEKNISVPRDIAIIAGDGNIYSQIVTPKITTMQIDHSSLGTQAMEMMINLINGNCKTYEIQIKQKLTIRESA